MRTKITALALGLLLLVVPGAFAQYGGGGGAQTFTVPTLTINPGPLTLAGTFTIAGDLDFGADLVFGGTTFETTLTFTDPSADRTVTFQDASGDVALLPLAGASTFALATSLATNEVDVANSVWGVSNGLAFGGATGGNGFELTISPQNDPAGSIAVVIPNLTASAAMVSSLTTNDFNVANSVWGVSNGLTFEGATADAFENFLTVAEPAGSNKTWTLPNITGTVLLGGATNTLGAVTTTINSGTQFNIHSDANITLDGDADNDGTGTVSILSSNDTQQVLLTNTAISLVSDAQVSAQSNDLAGNINTFTAAAAIGSWEVTDGTGIARQQIDATGILIDGDYDNDGSGVVTISTDNSLQSVGLSATQVNLASNNQIVSTALATNFSSVVTQDATTSTVTPSFNVDVGDANTGTTGTLNLNMGTTAATRGLSFSNNSLAINTDIEFDLHDTLNDTWLTFTDVLVPTNVITFQQRADSDPSHILKVTDGTAYGQTSHGTNAGAAQGFVIDTATNATQTNTLALKADGTGLTYDMTGNTITDVDFDLHDALNDAWLTFTDIATPGNTVTYTQRVASGAGFTEIATNGTTSAALDVESDIFPRIHLDVTTATNNTKFSVDSLQGGRFEYLNSGNTAQMWTDNIAFTDAATIGLMTIGITNGAQQSGQLSYTAVESGGGIIIANRGVFSFACVNEADAEVCTSGSPAGTAFAEHSAVDGDSGATMACTPALTPGTNAVALSLACNTSSSAGGTIYWKVETEKDATNVTIP